MIERLAEKYSESVPNHQLVKYEYVAFPLYKIVLNITLLRRKELGIIEEFVMKLLEAGIPQEQLAEFLGLDPILVEDSLANLYKSDLIDWVVGKYKLTDKGHESLQMSKLIQPQEVKYNVLLDGLTGEFVSDRKILKSHEVKNYGYHTFTKDMEVPSVEDIDLRKLSRFIKKQQREIDNEFEGDLISINSIEKSFTVYKKRSVLIFMHNTMPDLIDIKVFEGLDRVANYEDIILRMERSGIRQLPTDYKLSIDDKKSSLTDFVTEEIINSAAEYMNRLAKLEVLEETLTKKIEEQQEVLTENVFELNEEEVAVIHEIDTLKNRLEEVKREKRSNNKLVETYGHRPLLERSLSEAKRVVVIVSPWIRFSAFDNELQKLIQDALKRKVTVILGYGISDNDPENEKAERILKDMKKQKYGKYLELQKLGNTHEKVLLVDGKYVVITSFNWLSFKGDPNRGFRQETGIYTEDHKTISSIIDSLENRMEIGIRKYITT